MGRRLGGIRRGIVAALVCLALGAFGAGIVNCGADDSEPASSAGSHADASTLDSSVADSVRPREAATPDTGKGAGRASLKLSATSVDFSLSACGGMPSGTQTLTITNQGTVSLGVAAKTTGSAFAVSPTALSVAPGSSGNLSLTVNVPASATAGTAIQGSLGLFTNDPENTSVSIALSAVPSGANLSVDPASPATSFAFPPGPVGVPSAPLTVQLRNGGNAPGIFTLAQLGDPSFSFTPDGGSNAVSAGTDWAITGQFTPPNTSTLTGSLTISTTSPVCGTSLTSIPASGDGAMGSLVGWPSKLDFGAADCGGLAPAPQAFTLINTGLADAHVTVVNVTGASGFATAARVGKTITANGGSATFQVTAPAVPNNSPLTPVTGTLTLQTDAESSPHTITLTEEPSGALLGFDTKVTPNFGNFGSIALLKSGTQYFNVTNTGTAPATVALSVIPGTAGDAGASEGGTGGTGSPAFSLSTPAFTLTPAQGTAPSTQQEAVTFTPQMASQVTSTIALTTSSPICGPLPTPISVTGSGLGGGPSVGPVLLAFPAACGGKAPAAQTFLVANNGTADFTWSLNPSAGVHVESDAGAGDAAVDATAAPPVFAVSADPAPGLLIPGASSLVTVTGAAIPSPAPTLDAASYSGTVTITTDVPLDPPHVVTLSKAPLGDQLSFSIGSPLRFGQIPVQTSIGQTLTVSNNASDGSPPANLSLVLGGAQAAGYAVAPVMVANLAPGSTSGAETVTFSPTMAAPYPATLGIQTSDALCTALPAPIQLSGTGTNGTVVLSTTTLALGTDPKDLAGLVNCGATGLPQPLTVADHGNQAFNIKSVTLGKSSSPFSFALANNQSLPVSLGIGVGSSPLTITVTPKPIPATVANPSDASQLSDTLTITTDAAGDSPHEVKLVMQARGAVISSASIPTAWSFGSVSYGSIGRFTSTIQNTGNAPATIALAGLAQPTIFTLQSEPDNVPGNGPGGAYTSIAGEFIPPSSNGVWSDQANLVLTAPNSFCGSPPAGWTSASPDAGTAGAQAQWTGPTLQFSGSSNSSPAVTISGSLAFPASNCGEGAPAAQAVMLTNLANVAFPFTASFSSGKYYTSTVAMDGGTADASSGGVLAANGTSMILVQPSTILSGPGVVPGSAPYVDNLLLTVVNPNGNADAGTSNIATFTVPISWALNGAVFSLPAGYTRVDDMGNPYYPADSTGEFSLPMRNSGTASAYVTLVAQPSENLSISPMPPIEVLASGVVSPLLTSTSYDVDCSSGSDAGADAGSPAVTPTTVSFSYAGPVCQPFPVASVTVGACSGTFGP